MTSKNSLFDLRLIREKMRHSTWATALFAVMMFFALPVFSLFAVQNAAERLNTNAGNIEQIIANSQIHGVIYSRNIMTIGAIMLIAVVMAAAVFKYQHNKKQVDFYHSLPVTRQSLFVANFMSGLISFLAVYLINLAIAVLIIAVSPFAAAISFGALISTIVTNIFGFLAIYAVAIFAQVIAASAITAILATVSLLAAGPVIYFMQAFHMDRAFETFFLPMSELLSANVHLSPVVFFAARALGEGATGTIYWLLLTAGLIALSWFMFCKRPSEAAGRAVAFKLPAAILKYAVVVAVALVIGYIFNSLNGSFAWTIFGVICGAVISHCVIEAIFHFEFKALFCHWKAMAVVTLAICAMVTALRVDLFGYDKFVPEIGNIRAAEITLDGRHSSGQMRDVFADGKMDITDKETIKAIMGLAKTSIDSEGQAPLEDFAAERVRIGYKTKLGRKIYREYFVYTNPEEAQPDLITIYNSEEYKRSTFDIFNMEAGSMRALNFVTAFGEQGANVTKIEQVQQIRTALIEETLAHRAEDLKASYPIGHVEFFATADPEEIEGNYREYLRAARIYPEFTKTIELLKQAGAWHEDTISAEDVDYIGIREESRQWVAQGWDRRYYDEEEQIKITDPAKIRTILNGATLISKIYHNNLFVADPYRITVYMKESNKYGELLYAFEEGKFPIGVLE